MNAALANKRFHQNLIIQMEMFIQEIRSEQIGLAGGGFFMLTKKSTSTVHNP